MNDKIDRLAAIRRDIEMFSVGTTQTELVEAMLRTTPMLAIDMETGVIFKATPAADELFGYIEGELEGKHINDLIPERLHDVHAQHVALFVSNPHKRSMGTQGIPLRARRRDGTEIEIEAGLYPRVIRGKRLVLQSILPTRTHTESTK